MKEIPKEFGCAKYYWQLKSAIRRGSVGSEWGPQILKYADDFKLYPSSFLTWHRLLDLGKSTYLYFFAGTTSRISPKAQSHAAAEERFRRGESIQTSRPFTGRLAAKGSDGKKGRWTRRCLHVWVLVLARANGVCEAEGERKAYNPQRWGFMRGV